MVCPGLMFFGFFFLSSIKRTNFTISGILNSAKYSMIFPVSLPASSPLIAVTLWLGLFLEPQVSAQGLELS